MKKNALIATVILFFASIANFFREAPKIQIRTVDFISILAMGALAGVLLTQIFILIKNKKQSV